MKATAPARNASWTRIAIRQDKSTGSKQALLAEIYEAMRETVQVKNGGRFMAITEHGDTEFAYGSLLGIERSDDPVQIQISGYRERAPTAS
jgi:4-oxalocrotonate tautomerase